MDISALNHLKKNLGKDADDFISALSLPPKRAVRVNRLKASPDKVAAALSLSEKTAYNNGAYLAPETLSGAHPYHQAGVLYFQEPSAMLSIEAAKPYLSELFGQSEYPLALDMCAAPGGKAGQLAELLGGRGALIANETDYKRARVLAFNLERLGVRNCAVLSSPTDKLAGAMGEVFDAVIVDAPCSGEGMLRKEESAWDNMNEKTVLACAERQSGILANALKCLAGGGILVYSTCTLNQTENENVLAPYVESGVLEPLECPHLKLVRVSERFPAYRAFPQDGGGEGHFVCVMRKTGERAFKPRLSPPVTARFPSGKALTDCLSALSADVPLEPAYRFKDDIIICPLLPPLKNLCVLKAGVKAASVTKSGLIPDHCFALSLTAKEAKPMLGFACEIGTDEEKALGRKALESYLSGSELPCPGALRGWGLICADGYPLGLIKSSNGSAKNHYPKGLRLLSFGERK